MNFFLGVLNWFGGFFSDIFQDIKRQVYIKTGSAGALGWILLIFKKWYIMVMVPSIVTLYWVLKGLDEAGILNGVENFISYQLDIIMDVAKNCTRHILDKDTLGECLEDPAAF